MVKKGIVEVSPIAIIVFPKIRYKKEGVSKIALAHPCCI